MATGKIIARGQARRPDRRARRPRDGRGLRAAGPARRGAREGRGARACASGPPGPPIAIVGSESATDGAVPEDAVRRAASLEDVFVLLTGEEAE